MTRTAKPRHPRLAYLMAELFTPAELQHVVRTVHPELVIEIPDPGQAVPLKYSFDVAAALERRGLVDARWLAAIVAWRPERLADIRKVADLLAIDLATAPALPRLPYRGLQRFEPEHAGDYFGHRTALDALVGRLSASSAVCVVGESGSGKSSLVRAGLAKVTLSTSLQAWQRVYLTPSEAPRDATKAALPTYLQEEFLKHWGGANILPQPSPPAVPSELHHSTMIIVDQLERLFSETDEIEQRQYARAIHSLCSPTVKVIWVTRADCFDRALRIPELESVLEKDLVVVGRMSFSELRQVIEEPARRAGVGVEAALATALIDEVSNRAGNLALLQFALTSIWERDASTGMLRLSTLEHLAGPVSADTPRVAAVLAKRAEGIVRTLTPQDLARLPAVLVPLVSVSLTRQGPENAISARRASLSDYDAESRRVANRLTDSFILVSGSDSITQQSTIELAHEALLRTWPRLRDLVNGHLEFTRWFQHTLLPAYEQWQRERRSRSYLLPASSLRRDRRFWKSREFAAVVPKSVRRFVMWSRLVLAGRRTLICAVLAGSITIALDGSHAFKSFHLKRRMPTQVATSGLAGLEPITAAVYFRGWYQTFDRGRIIYVSVADRLEDAPTVERRAFVLQELPDGRQRWLADLDTNPMNLRDEGQFCQLFAEADPNTAERLGFRAHAPALTCEQAFRKGQALNFAPGVGVTGSIAFNYAKYRLDRYLGKAQINECSVSGVLTMGPSGFAFGGLPNDVCGPDETSYFLSSDSMPKGEPSRGAWQRRHAPNALSAFYPALNRRRAIDVLREWATRVSG